jgi:hypothetical protein
MRSVQGALGCIRRGFCGGLGVYRGKGEEAVVSRGVENEILEIWKAVGVERVRKAEK